MQTLAFLGAGFSQAITNHVTSLAMPLAREVLMPAWSTKFDFGDIELGPKWITDPNSPLPLILRRDFGMRWHSTIGWARSKTDKPADYEVVYSHCQLRRNDPLLSPLDRAQYDAALTHLNHYLSNLLNSSYYETCKLPSTANERLEGFLDRLGDRALIFTTNVDNLLFRPHADELSRLYPRIAECSTRSFNFLDQLEAGNAHEFGFGWGGSHVFYLHGNVMWQSCSNEKCRAFDSPYNKPIPAHRAYPRHCIYCGSATSPEILAPITMKSYERKTLYNRMLVDFKNALIAARRVVLCGYSFPLHDSLLNSWFLINLHRNGHVMVDEQFGPDSNIPGVRVEVIRPKKDLLKMLHSSFGDSLDINCYADLDAFLASEPAGQCLMS